MPYTGRHKTQDTRHKHWQLYAQNLSQHTIVDSLHQSDNLVTDLAPHRRQPNYLNLQQQSLPPKQQLHSLLPIKRTLHLVFSLKRCLALMPWLLLPYATTTKALSATTAQVIHGTQPYLTFDNGVTKVTTTEDLLGITLSNGNSITPATNISTATNPIQLPEVNQSFADIGMLVPTTTNSIALSTLIGAPYNYWGDDDGDGQGTNGITATGNLRISITDKNNQTVSRSDVLSLCSAPYKVVLTSTAGSLTTQYGLPNSSNFSGSTATYYISPKAAPAICYARPFSMYGGQGPATIWDSNNGFIVQSIEPSGYYRNFPTTGANNLYFDLDIGGGGGSLTWPTVTMGGITATMTPTPDNPNNIRVTLTGPLVTSEQHNSISPSPISKPNLPQSFELRGYDSSHRVILKYGFVLNHWFVNRGRVKGLEMQHTSWCSSLGYRMPLVKDLSNGRDTGERGFVSATPTSNDSHFMRYIAAGFFTEWGTMPEYDGTGFVSDYYLTSDVRENARENRFIVRSHDGYIRSSDPREAHYGLCTYP